MAADSVDRRALIYNRLNRRNRFVGLLRWAVPLLGLLLAGSLIVQIIIANLSTQYDISGLSIEDGKVVIADPRYSGLVGETTRYEVAADAALVPMDNAEQIDLQGASITTIDENGYRMEGVAPFAHLDLSQERVSVDGELTTVDSEGVEAELFSTIIDWRNQSMHSRGPVYISFPDEAEIRAESLTYSGESDVWQFGTSAYTAPADETRAATRITASELIYDAKANTAVFSGDAVVLQTDNEIASDSIEVTFGSSGTSELERIVALGGVTVTNPNQTATGNRGEYDPATQVMDLNGEVKVVSETGTINADRLSVDLSRDVTEFSTDGQSRVRGDFSPPGADRAQIEADRMVDLRAENRTEFSGGTVVRMAQQTVWANRFIVNYQAGNPDMIASYEMLGSVRVRNSTQTATGERGVYNPDTRILRLTGNVQVTNESGTVNAPELRVNLATNVSEFSGPGEGNRVSGVFSPDSAPETQ